MNYAQCPYCAAAVRYAPSQVGTAVNCPACGQAMQLPAPVALAPAAPADEPSFDFRRGPGGGGPEPWYYGFLEGYAQLAMFLGIASVVLCGIGVIAAAVIWGGLGDGRMTPAGAVSLVVGGLAWLLVLASFLLVILFQVALVLLVVDIGRNLRKIRQNTQQ